MPSVTLITYVTLPSASAKERKNILEICKQTDCEIKNLPGMYQLASGDVTVSSLKNVDVEDLLGREPVKMNSEEVTDFLSGKTVLITGGGGSIGSELCRQVASAPGLKQLIIFDIYENNAHAIKLELNDKYRDWGRDCICSGGHDNFCGHRFDGQYGDLPRGYDHKYVYSHFGFNMKITEMQAAIGCRQLL